LTFFCVDADDDDVFFVVGGQRDDGQTDRRNKSCCENEAKRATQQQCARPYRQTDKQNNNSRPTYTIIFDHNICTLYICVTMPGRKRAAPQEGQEAPQKHQSKRTTRNQKSKQTSPEEPVAVRTQDDAVASHTLLTLLSTTEEGDVVATQDAVAKTKESQ
jgi:hypothetical protein